MTEPGPLDVAALKGHHVLHLAEAVARYPDNELEKTRALTLVAVELLGALCQDDCDRQNAVAWNLHAALLAEWFWLGASGEAERSMPFS